MVVIGVLTGPSVIDCFGGPDNAGMCLRDKLAGAGLAPPAATAPEAESGKSTAEAQAPATEAEAAPSERAVPEDLIAATFGLLRAEPDGSVVIAGSGTPGSEVEVYADEELIGRTTVEESGDWVLVPEEPIAPGGREITLAEAGKDGRAGQSFVVVINPDRDSQPLVVASEPGEASEVLQGIERPESMEVASVPDEATAAPETPQEPAQPPAAPNESSIDDADPPADAAAASDAPPAPASEAPTAAGIGQTASEAAEEPVSDPEPVAAPVEAAAEPEAAVAEPEVDEPASASAPEPAPEPAAPAAEPEAEIAAAATTEPAALTAQPPASVALEPVEAAVQPTIDAIEIDGERTFFAGAGPDGATMRLYVDDVFIADALVDGGRWLVEAGDILPGPQHAVRIDMLDANSAEVAARAEVNFRVDVPAQPTAVAQAPAAGQQPPATEAAEPAGSQSQPQPGTGADPVTAPAEAAATPEPESAGPGSAIDFAEAADAGAVPTMVAEAVGDPELQRFASGRAIIRRGDNLWTIARRVYGQGIKYTTIYEANTAQIRDPDWIYPGQVFDLPQAEQ